MKGIIFLEYEIEMKKTIWTIFYILFVSAALSACSSDAFPTGTYTHGDFTHIFRDDGTFTYFCSEVRTEGTYAIQGDEITFTDSYCNEKNAGSATYKWQYEDDQLRFDLIGEDLCKDRRSVLSVVWWGPK